jgi:hypothetical protein
LIEINLKRLQTPSPTNQRRLTYSGTQTKQLEQLIMIISKVNIYVADVGEEAVQITWHPIPPANIISATFTLVPT